MPVDEYLAQDYRYADKREAEVINASNIVRAYLSYPTFTDSQLNTEFIDELKKRYEEVAFLGVVTNLYGGGGVVENMEINPFDDISVLQDIKAEFNNKSYMFTVTHVMVKDKVQSDL